jgi:hypothetical protein
MEQHISQLQWQLRCNAQRANPTSSVLRWLHRSTYVSKLFPNTAWPRSGAPGALQLARSNPSYIHPSQCGMKKNVDCSVAYRYNTLRLKAHFEAQFFCTV